MNALQDFRSEEGLYSLIQAQYDVNSSSTTSNVLPNDFSSDVSRAQAINPSTQRCPPNKAKGKQLFDAQLWSEPTSTSVFYRFISSLREKIRQDVKKTTPTHRFIRMMRDQRKLVRCYTQNIDGLETWEGLSTDLSLGKGSRQRFMKKSIARPLMPMQPRPGGDLDPGCEVVQLHGELENLRCTLCQKTCSWDQRSAPDKAMLRAGTAPLCQSCLATNQDRQERGKRSTKIGTLRPNIVLYGEEHPSADVLGSIATHDLTLHPDVLLVLGTSLHVHGLKTLVREFAKSVHARPGRKGQVIFVNLSKPSESVWKDVFDYWVSMDCDAWVGAMRKHRPDLFQVQEELRLSTRKTTDKSPLQKPSIPLAETSQDKENIVTKNDTSLSVNKASRPMVLVPVIPKKKAPLQERRSERASPRGVKVTDHDTSARVTSGPSTTPPQRPTSSPTSTEVSAKKRRWTLAGNQYETVQTPSKRRKLPVNIWTEVGAGA